MRKTMIFVLSAVVLCACQEPSRVSSVIPTTDPDSSVIVVKDVCGDGILSSKEVCDSTLFSTSKDCRTYGFDSGEVSCSSTCSLDFSTCKKNEENKGNEENKEDPNGGDNGSGKENNGGKEEINLCGNGVKDAGEDCDSNLPLGLCENYGSTYTGGYVYCSSSCQFDYSQCVKKPVCGDGKREGSEEQCDTKEVIGHCANFGDYDIGEVLCSSECKIDYSQCEKLPVCGNGIVEKGEECDDENQVDNDSCTNHCTLPKCGDDILSYNEECDGNLFSISTCSEYNPNFDTGVISCNSDCTLNTSKCSVSPKCGDGVINSVNEECEVGQAITATCLDRYEMATGRVVCTSCQLDYSNCVETCPTNRLFNDGEYSAYSTNTKVRSVTDSDGTLYIVYTQGNKERIGKSISSKLIRWISSTENDEGYYSKFETNCGCQTCDITISQSYGLKQDALNDTSATTKRYTYSTLTNNPVPNPKPTVINFPENLVTQFDYGSCNSLYTFEEVVGNDKRSHNINKVKACADYDNYFYTISGSTLKISTEDFGWIFSLVKDLGNNQYLVYYKSGSGVPVDFNKDGIKNPYAVIRITKEEKYTLCDWDGVQDTRVEFLSWSGYRDTAINYPEYSSNIDLLYKPILQYSEGDSKYSNDDNNKEGLRKDYFKSCGNYKGGWYFTEKDNYGANIYSYNFANMNICNDFFYEKDSWGYTQKYYIQKESVLSYEMSGRYLQGFYPSLYRNNVMVKDVDTVKLCVDTEFPTRQYKCNSTTYRYDVKRLEIEFSDPSDIDVIVNCETEHPDYIIKENNYCIFSIVYPEYPVKGNSSTYYPFTNDYDGQLNAYWTNHLNSKNIKWCEVKQDDSRECVNVVLYANSLNDELVAKSGTGKSVIPWRFTCTSIYQ